MAMSTQRMFIVLFVLKLLIMPLILTQAGGNSIQNYQNDYYESMMSNFEENQGDFEDGILNSNIDPSKDFQNDKIGSSSIGIKKTYVGNLLSTGLSTWIPLGIADDDYEEMFLMIINIFSIIITIVAGYELFQIVWGKKTN